ncbi:MAG: CHAT domain-containing protein [Pseudomonadota bacterium]
MTTRIRPLQVGVLCGNLKFVGHPLLVGHYVASRLTGTEKVVDDYIGGAMSALLKAGRYPEQPGRFRFFANRRQNPLNPLGLPRPPHVLVAGLGPEGKLDSNQLLDTVREATIGWSQRMSDKVKDQAAPLELAVTLMGSGGSGIGPGTSAQAIVQGVQQANEVLGQGGWQRISHLQLVEMYLDRATEAWLALRQLHQATHGPFTLDDTVQSGMGALRRPIDTSYRGADYDYISAVTSEGGNIVYTLDTKRARTEVRIQATQVGLVRKLIERASGETRLDPELGGALFKLLVPAGMEATLGAITELVLELDDGTAAIPWELLDAPAGERGSTQEPWALRNRLLRRLRTVNFRGQVRDATRDDDVLVIGEPLVDATRYPELPAARAEANAVAKVLGGRKGVGKAHVHAFIAATDGAGPDATTVIKALLAHDYRVVHIAGHGEPPLPTRGRSQVEQPRGVVLSDGAFLGPREVAAMRTVPELVFLNCCHLAADPQKLLHQGFDRSAFAAAVARELIRVGVRCVVAAGWAVDDDPANAFAVGLYASLLEGKRFADAVNDARRAAWRSNPRSNTWAAYQCYGDQDWTWQRRGGTDTTTHSAPDPARLYGAIATPTALVIALETLAIENDTQGAWTARERKAQHAAQRRQLRYLEARFAGKWGTRGDVAAAFGIVWMKADETKRALHWLEIAITANDGGASMRAAEQRANLLARRARSRRDIDAARTALQALLAIGATAEREALLGSVNKRLARMESAAGNRKAETQALKDMAACYRRGEILAIRQGSADVFYPALNLLAAELLAGQKLDAARVRRTRASLQGRQLADPDFWSAVGLAELEILVALDAHGLAKAAHSIEEVLEDLHSRAGGPWLWESTADQLDFILARVSKVRGDEGKAARRLRTRVRGYANPR